MEGKTVDETSVFQIGLLIRRALERIGEGSVPDDFRMFLLDLCTGDMADARSDRSEQISVQGAR